MLYIHPSTVSYIPVPYVPVPVVRSTQVPSNGTEHRTCTCTRTCTVCVCILMVHTGSVLYWYRVQLWIVYHTWYAYSVYRIVHTKGYWLTTSTRVQKPSTVLVHAERHCERLDTMTGTRG